NHLRIRPLPTEERCVLLADAKINAGGVHTNVPFLEAAQAFATKERDAINAQISKLTSGTITSVDQVPRIQKAVNAHGHNMTTLGKHSVSAVLAHKPDDFTREILTLRQRGSAIKPKKFQTLLNHTSREDHRIRHALRFHGAGPGRWTSIGAQ